MTLLRKSLIVVLLLMLVSVIHAQDDTLTFGDVVESRLRTDSSSEEFVFEGDGGTLVEIRVESTDFDPNVTLLDGDGNSMGYDDDGGGERNALLIQVLPTSGDFIIRVGALSGTGSGDYVLRLNTLESVTVDYDEPIEVTFENADPHFVVFEGSEGDVVNLAVEPSADFDGDLVMSLRNASSSYDLAYDDDSGGDYMPYIRKFLLPSDGFYVVKLAGISEDSDVEGVVTLTVEETELAVISAEPLTLTMGETARNDTVTFEAEEDTTYRLSLNPSDPTASFYVEIKQGDTGIANLSVYSTSGVMFDFVTNDAGSVIVVVSGYYGSESEAELDITLTKAE